MAARACTSMHLGAFKAAKNEHMEAERLGVENW